MTLSARSQLTILSTVFLACVSFSIVMPSLWPYLHGFKSSKRFLAAVVSFYSVGEGIGAVLFGALAARRRTRNVMLEATAIGAIGSALYATAPLCSSPRLGALVVLIARFAQGVWSGGAQAAQQTHLAKTLPVGMLTAMTVAINAYACFGFVVGPSFALVFDNIPPFCIVGTRLCVNQLTAPGYFVFVSALATIVMFACCFDDDDDDTLAQAEAAAMTTTQNDNPADKVPSVKQGKGRQSENTPSERSPLIGNREKSELDEGNLSLAIIVCNLCFFVHFYGFAFQETITTPLVEAYYIWDVHEANWLFTGAGVCSLLVFFAVGRLSRVVPDRVFTLISLALGALGYALLVPQQTAHGILSEAPDVHRFLFAFAVISVAFPLGRATIMSLYTKILPMRMQGSGQGAILAVGALARIIGPFGSVLVFGYEFGSTAVFGGTALLFLLSAATFRLAYPVMWCRLECAPYDGESLV